MTALSEWELRKLCVVIASSRPEDTRVAERVVSHLAPSLTVVLGAAECPATHQRASLTVESDVSAHGVHVHAEMTLPDGEVLGIDDFDESICDARFDSMDWARRRNERIRRSVLQLMVPRLAARGSLFWGILFGVRPTKLVHRFMDKAFSAREIQAILQDNYLVSPEKASLITEVAALQRTHLLTADEARHKVSVYVGIPFCPTRCHYCSFAAYPLGTHSHLVKGFVQALKREISEVGGLCRRHGLEVQTAYIGGGTPSSLGPESVEDLLTCLTEAFGFKPNVEFTFEAGRPDTITQHLLDVLRAHGVNRISINPQTMNARTLAVIGRSHSPEDVVRAMELAKPMGFDSINMDVILGLPGETPDDVTFTFDEIRRLEPHNLTVHTLSMKHAAKWRRNLDLYSFPGDADVLSMLEQSRNAATGMGMVPYYLYRQRFISADLENVGYCLPGLESVYNIQMMEERQTVIGLGGGGVSKLVIPGVWELERHFNQKCPATFAGKYGELVPPKLRLLEEFLSSKMGG